MSGPSMVGRLQENIEPPAEDFSLDIQELLSRKLQFHYPWMKAAAVNQASSTCGEVLRTTIEAQVPVMRKSKDMVSFTSLPQELRDQIYELALIKTTYAGEPDSIDVIWGGRKTMFGSDGPLKQPLLTKVCRQVRGEALSIFYAQNEFTLTVVSEIFGKLLKRIIRKESASAIFGALLESKQLHTAGDWLRAIGYDNVKLITRFDIMIDAQPGRQNEQGFSALEPHSEAISLAIDKAFQSGSANLPPSTNFLPREYPIDFRTLEWGTKRQAAGWKPLSLCLGRDTSVLASGQGGLGTE